MIYTGLGRVGEIADVKANGGADVAEVYGGIGESNPIFYSRKTLTGTSPLTFKGLGQPLKDYLISGNTIQDGTPSPDMPVDVVGCGDRTENLFPQDSFTGMSNAVRDGFNAIASSIVFNNGQYTLRVNVTTNSEVGVFKLCFTYTDGSQTKSGWISKGPAPVVLVSNSGKVVKSISITDYNNYTDTTLFNIMLNTGSTALPYEPYGYKLPITVNGTEYPIYLGQVPTTRRIKKLVFDGTENWSGIDTLPAKQLTLDGYSLIKAITCVCTHYDAAKNVYAGDVIPYNSCCFYLSPPYNVFFLKGDESSEYPKSTAGFKAWLATQYAAGTPVTVWYVLAEPETAVVNEPLHKIGDYADTVSFAQAGETIPTIAGSNTLSVGTPVQPSQVIVDGRLKPDGYGNLTDVNGVYIRDKDGVQIKAHGQ